jgi:hypothetical protein
MEKIVWLRKENIRELTALKNVFYITPTQDTAEQL